MLQGAYYLPIRVNCDYDASSRTITTYPTPRYRYKYMHCFEIQCTGGFYPKGAALFCVLRELHDNSHIHEEPLRGGSGQ